jgi:hypothetical protein
MGGEGNLELVVGHAALEDCGADISVRSFCAAPLPRLVARDVEIEVLPSAAVNLQLEDHRLAPVDHDLRQAAGGARGESSRLRCVGFKK